MELLGVILSGGKSSRMGTDKGLVEFHNKPLVQYTVDVLAPLCDELILSTNSMDYLKFGYQTIPDLVPYCGPISGIHAAMTMIKSDYYFVSSCDIPNLSGNLGKEMIRKKTMGDITVPRHSGNKIEPLFAIYSYKVLETIVTHINQGDYKLMNLLESCKTYYIDADKEGYSNTIFKNINSQTDLFNA